MGEGGSGIEEGAKPRVVPAPYIPADVPPPTPQRTRLCVALANCRAAGSDPDPQKPMLTGRYEEDEDDFTLNVNQAGRHIECWMAEVLTAAQRRPKNLYRFAGDLEKDGTFRVYPVDEPMKHKGRILPDANGGGLRFELDGVGTSHFQRRSGVTTLSERAMKRLPTEQEVIRLYEWTPLPRSYLVWIREKLAEEVVNGFLAAYFDVGNASGVVAELQRAVRARELAAYLGAVFSTEPPHGWHYQDLPLARLYAQQVLAVQRWTRGGVKRSQLDWTQIILSQVASYKLWDKGLENIRGHLGLRAESDIDPERPAHTYEFAITAGGLAGDVGIGLGGFVGGAEIEKPGDVPWGSKKIYSFWMAGLSGGASVGLSMGFRTTGTGTSSSVWAPSDFPGWYTMVDLGAHAGLGVGGGVGGTAMFVYGSGNHPPIAVNLSGVTPKSEIGGGVEVGGSFGRIGDIGSDYREREALHVEVDDDYALEVGLEDQVHFRLGSALLKPTAWQLLRVFCAKELTALMSPGSRLEIVGHADRLAPDDFNEELSDFRARNTLQAIRDILGSQFQIADSSIKTFGLGERKAAEASEPDETPNPSWRKVHVILNSRLAVTLRGE